jgi:uncharacterized protein
MKKFSCIAMTMLLTNVCFMPFAQADVVHAQLDYQAKFYSKAHDEFLEVAALGNAEAQYNLGAMALRGEGGETDRGTAVGWLLAAEENGYHGLPPDKLQALQSSLTAEQRANADRIVSQYGRAALRENVLPIAPGEGPVFCPGFQPGHTLQVARLNYPLLSRENRQDGVVFTSFTIGVDGLAHDPEVIVAAPPGMFERSAVQGILSGRYEPARLNGVPFESRSQLRTTFSMSEGGVLWRSARMQKLIADAREGQPAAQYFVGLAGLLDPTVGVAEPEARKMLFASAQAGIPGADYWLARVLEMRRPCTRFDKSQLWLEQAARGGSASAKTALAERLLARHGADDLTRAHELLVAAVDSNETYALKHAAALLATTNIDGFGDSELALRAAAQLDKVDTIEVDPQGWEAAAAAQAAAGAFSKAASLQRKAIKLATDYYWNTSAMQERLNAYEKGERWYGDLFAVPPATGPLPDVKVPGKLCQKDCGRKHGDLPRH